MSQELSLGMGLSCCFQTAQELYSIVYDSCGIIREEVVCSLKQYASPAQGCLIERVSFRAADIFSSTCVLGGVLIIPAVFVFLIRRGGPCFSVASEFFRSDSTMETLVLKWNEAKAEYRRICVEEIAPALIVAFAVDALFSIVIGVFTLNVYHVVRAGVVSLPVAYSLYRLLLDRCEAIMHKPSRGTRKKR